MLNFVFFLSVLLFGPDRSKCGICNHCACRCNAAGVSFSFFSFVFFFHPLPSVHTGLFSFHVNFKYLKFILIKRCLQFSPQGPGKLVVS